ncbi:MAG: hypothetical protein CMC22_00075 [Flavobacteriaceae bacterium]|jgi:hypothetical protein|nr:hypothetical protein [Flavobacteriaceae bacterium]|tara:strand:+ start:1106 stop:1441 length:336 start_codon:yes stop_codon:yes gene_type:complete
MLFFVGCKTQENKSKESDGVEAFSKIDKKSESLFTKKDRVNNYKKSIAKAESLNKSLKENANYSGYGATAINNKSQKLKEDKTKTENILKKKTNYDSKSLNSQVYSAYSTN